MNHGITTGSHFFSLRVRPPALTLVVSGSMHLPGTYQRELARCCDKHADGRHRIAHRHACHSVPQWIGVTVHLTEQGGGAAIAPQNAPVSSATRRALLACDLSLRTQAVNRDHAGFHAARPRKPADTESSRGVQVGVTLVWATFG